MTILIFIAVAVVGCLIVILGLTPPQYADKHDANIPFVVKGLMPSKYSDVPAQHAIMCIRRTLLMLTAFLLVSPLIIGVIAALFCYSPHEIADPIRLWISDRIPTGEEVLLSVAVLVAVSGGVLALLFCFKEEGTVVWTTHVSGVGEVGRHEEDLGHYRKRMTRMERQDRNEKRAKRRQALIREFGLRRYRVLIVATYVAVLVLALVALPLIPVAVLGWKAIW